MTQNEIDHMIVRSLQRRALPEVEGVVEEWCAADPKNWDHFVGLVAVWNTLDAMEVAPAGQLDPAVVARKVIQCVEARDQASSLGRGVGSMQEQRQHMSGDPWRSAGRRVGVRRNAWVVGAVGLALAAGVAGLIAVQGPQAPWFVEPGIDSVVTEVSTGAGEVATLNLIDGTAIRLGPESMIRFEVGSEGNISVWLEGRGFFGVEPSSTRVFTVRTPSGEATALGTRFEVSSLGSDFSVTVLEGTVRVSASGGSLELGEGLVGRSSGGSVPSTTPIEDMEEVLAWMGRTLVFRSTPLHRVAAEISRAYNIGVEIADPRLGQVTVSATLTDRPLEEVLKIVCETVGASCEFDGETLVMGAELPPLFNEAQAERPGTG